MKLKWSDKADNLKKLFANNLLPVPYPLLSIIRNAVESQAPQSHVGVHLELKRSFWDRLKVGFNPSYKHNKRYNLSIQVRVPGDLYWKTVVNQSGTCVFSGNV